MSLGFDLLRSKVCRTKIAGSYRDKWYDLASTLVASLRLNPVRDRIQCELCEENEGSHGTATTNPLEHV